MIFAAVMTVCFLGERGEDLLCATPYPLVLGTTYSACSERGPAKAEGMTGQYVRAEFGGCRLMELA